MTHALRDFATFLGAWLRAPHTIASVTPSSAALARLITSRITATDGPVIELGPGTGVFTRALLARGVPERQLLLVEAHPELAALLRVRHPAACVLCMDAAKLAALDPLHGELAGAAVSGLPILWMSPRSAEMILRGVFRLLRIGGALYQFTYQARCPIPPPVLDTLDLRAIRIGKTWANFPPASVYRISRRRDQASEMPRHS